MLIFELLSGETPFLPSEKRDTLSMFINILLIIKVREIKIYYLRKILKMSG